MQFLPLTEDGLIIAAIGLYLIWTTLTYLLEGLRKTFLKPVNSIDRVVYTLVTNVLVGTVGSLLVIKMFTGQAGIFIPAFTTPIRTLTSIVAGIVLGLVLLALQKPATWEISVLIRGYSQTLVVSIAEVIVCWGVLGGAIALSATGLGGFGSKLVALLIASAAFGVYHFGHTAPFNSAKMVILLSVIGLFTGLFFLVTKDLFGTIIFHNFFAIKGVLDSLQARGLLDQFRKPQPVLVGTALVAAAVLVISRFWLVA